MSCDALVCHVVCHVMHSAITMIISVTVAYRVSLSKGRVDVILRVGLTSLPRSCKAPSDPASKLPVMGGAQRDVFVCVDHLTPYQSCVSAGVGVVLTLVGTYEP